MISFSADNVLEPISIPVYKFSPQSASGMVNQGREVKGIGWHAILQRALIALFTTKLNSPEFSLVIADPEDRLLSFAASMGSDSHLGHAGFHVAIPGHSLSEAEWNSFQQ